MSHSNFETRVRDREVQAGASRFFVPMSPSKPAPLSGASGAAPGSGVQAPATVFPANVVSRAFRAYAKRVAAAATKTKRLSSRKRHETQKYSHTLTADKDFVGINRNPHAAAIADVFTFRRVVTTPREITGEPHKYILSRDLDVNDVRPRFYKLADASGIEDSPVPVLHTTSRNAPDYEEPELEEGEIEHLLNDEYYVDAETLAKTLRELTSGEITRNNLLLLRLLYSRILTKSRSEFLRYTAEQLHELLDIDGVEVRINKGKIIISFRGFTITKLRFSLVHNGTSLVYTVEDSHGATFRDYNLNNLINALSRYIRRLLEPFLPGLRPLLLPDLDERVPHIVRIIRYTRHLRLRKGLPAVFVPLRRGVMITLRNDRFPVEVLNGGKDALYTLHLIDNPHHGPLSTRTRRVRQTVIVTVRNDRFVVCYIDPSNVDKMNLNFDIRGKRFPSLDDALVYLENEVPWFVM